ncbi:MAG: peptidoglycan-associated outer rane lipoprotein [Labilithrix sp.]|nr:peptidoglycan-associated outer rane lipoprotein [Labilithrix sp.]
MKLRTLGVSLTCVLALVSLTSCGGSRSRSSAPPTALGQPTELDSARVRPAGESIGISDEIARACNIRANDVNAAPKYDFDKSDLQPGDRATLMKVAECLTNGALKGRSIQLIGRADTRGESNYNMALGAQRAGGVADYLAHLGVARGRLGVTSRGELDAAGVDEASWQVDRRVDILLAK